MTALSPRNPPPRLRSTSVEEGSQPRKQSSHYERIATRRGYTIKAGKKTRTRIQPFPVTTRKVEINDPTVEPSP